jgi:hypothetical protein
LNLLIIIIVVNKTIPHIQQTNLIVLPDLKKDLENKEEKLLSLINLMSILTKLKEIHKTLKMQILSMKFNRFLIIIWRYF